MEITDYNTDMLNNLSELKALLVRAVNAAYGNAAKTAWLTAVLVQATTASTSPTLIGTDEWEQDDKSDSSIPGVKKLCSRVLGKYHGLPIGDRIILAGVFSRAHEILVAQ